jgi:hypothetical protein
MSVNPDTSYTNHVQTLGYYKYCIQSGITAYCDIGYIAEDYVGEQKVLTY